MPAKKKPRASKQRKKQCKKLEKRVVEEQNSLDEPPPELEAKAEKQDISEEVQVPSKEDIAPAAKAISKPEFYEKPDAGQKQYYENAPQEEHEAQSELDEYIMEEVAESVRTAYQKEQTLNSEDIRFFVEDSKLVNVPRKISDMEYVDKQEQFKWWKLFNRGLEKIKYRLSFT